MSGYEVAPAMCVIGEPTSMRVVRSHKGSRNYRCSVKGKAAHASMTHEGVNAIRYAAAMVGKIHDFAEALEGMTFPDSGYEQAYDMLQTSLITGGVARNIVPSQCEFTFGYRYLPQSDPDRIFQEIEDYGLRTVLPRMRAKCENSDLKFEKLSDNPALRDDQNREAARIVAARKGVQGAGPHVGFMTEGGLYQQAGIPTVICGPGSIEQAHKPDEYVDISQLSLCSTFLEDLFTHCAS
jgi:acetylornithine deacetylase